MVGSIASKCQNRLDGSVASAFYYPHMPIGKVWLYRLLFVISFVCMITDFSGENKASGIQFCIVVQRRSGQEISHLGEIFSPRSPKSNESATHPEVC